MKTRVFLLVIILNWVLSACQGNESAVSDVVPLSDQAVSEEGMVLGIFPYLSLTRLEEIWVPIVVEFNKSSDFHLQFRSTNSFEEFNERLNSSGYDFALVQPFDYIQMSPNTYEPLVSFDEPLAGIFVVREDSDIHDLSGLAGKTISTPPATAAVTILAEITLNTLGVENVIYSHRASHDQCLHALLISEADACVTNIVPLRTFEESLSQSFTILDSTLEIPHVLIVARAGIPDEQKERVKDFFLGLNSYDEGRMLLMAGGITGFKEALDSDYDIVREYWAELGP